MTAERTVQWCHNCWMLAAPDHNGFHDVRPETVRWAFRESALDAIPNNLIATPAVASGDARRYKLADAMWPVVEQLLLTSTEADR